MAKRTADEAFAVVGEDGAAVAGGGDDRVRTKDGVVVVETRSAPRPVGCAPPPPSLASEPPPGAAQKSLPRTVTRLDDDDDVVVAARGAVERRGEEEDVVADAGRRRLLRLINARVLRRDGSLPRGSMTVDPSRGVIVDVRVGADGGGGSSSSEDDDFDGDEGSAEVVDCEGRILAPGFVDVQLNGAYGVDFSDDAGGLTAEDVLRVARRLVETGVTSFCPTMISSSPRTYRRILPVIGTARRRQRMRTTAEDGACAVGANILGMHLEGPFFAPSKRGAHDLRHILAPKKGPSSVKEVYGIDERGEGDEPSALEDIDIVTLAPELPGALDAIRSLTAPGPADPRAVVASCGHTEATYEDGMRALSRGATFLTHLYNAMDPFHHRKPGLVGLLSSEARLRNAGLERPHYGIICDGVHVHESAVAMAYRSHPRGCVLVTDAMAAMGLGDGDHSLGVVAVRVEAGRAVLAGSDTLAGSVASMDACVRRFRRFAGCSIGDALLCATLHPATVVRRDVIRRAKGRETDAMDAPIGILEVGAKADFVVVNENLDILETWISGTRAFQNNK